jgi:hypothetical protein
MVSECGTLPSEPAPQFGSREKTEALVTNHAFERAPGHWDRKPRWFEITPALISVDNRLTKLTTALNCCVQCSKSSGSAANDVKFSIEPERRFFTQD